MKASNFITHLQEMIDEHGDLPLALLERSDNNHSSTFVEIGKVEGVVELGMYDKLIDENDCHNFLASKVFLVD